MTLRPVESSRFFLAVVLLLLGLLFSTEAHSAEVYFHDGRREMAMVDAVTTEGKLRLRSASGETREVPVEDIVSIQFWGREPRSVRSGIQEFHLTGGDRVRGQITSVKNDVLNLASFAAGQLQIPAENIHGFLALPVQGAAGRRAEELLGEAGREPSGYLDQVLDRRSANYEGVLEDLSTETLELDDEQLMRTTSIKVLYLAGVRLAEATKKDKPPLPDKVFMRIVTRDGSALAGFCRHIEFGKWELQPLWDPDRTLNVRVDEIVYVEVLNGRTLYLSQLEPIAVTEKTTLSPTQPYQRNRNCKKGVLSLGGNRYGWGVGVHADSELTYRIGGRFKSLVTTVGIDDMVGDQGSVIFTMLGDGKVLAQTPVVRGRQAPRELSVSIVGVDKLTLKVTSAGDLDLGDCADWAGARLVR